MPPVGYSVTTVLAEIHIDASKIVNLLLVGSRLHGTSLPSSDYDFLLVTSDDTTFPEGSKVERDNLDVTIFSRSEYIAKLQAGDDWQTIESLWLPSDVRWIFNEDFLPFYNHDLSKLRAAVSSIANKGHAYAKIMMTKQSNFHLGRKNLAHEIRNLRLGIQIIDHGRIIDYTETKEVYEQIMAETSEDWSYYNERWGSVAMAHQKEFISKTPEKVKVAKPRKQRRKNEGGMQEGASHDSQVVSPSSSSSSSAVPI